MTTNALMKEVLKKDVKQRGWSDAMIKAYLGGPDRVSRRYGGGEYHWYRLERVVEAERLPDFEQRQVQAEKRGVNGKKVAAKRAAELQAKAESWVPIITKMDRGALLDAAIDNYVPREDRLPASRDSDPAFLARITWNYIRHALTDYDETWLEYEGKPGVRDAYLIACERLVNAATDVYPDLWSAAWGWLERKRQADLHRL